MAKPTKADRFAVVRSPWRGGGASELVVDVRKNRCYDFGAQRDVTLGEALAEALGEAYDAQTFDSADIVVLMTALGYADALAEAKSVRGNQLLMPTPWVRARQPSLLIRPSNNRFVLLLGSYEGGPNELRLLVLHHLMQRGDGSGPDGE